MRRTREAEFDRLSILSASIRRWSKDYYYWSSHVDTGQYNASDARTAWVETGATAHQVTEALSKHGLAIGLVTADGQHLRVDTEHEPDLFWAIRGGGGNYEPFPVEPEHHAAGLM
jgi:hypothetical protein